MNELGLGKQADLTMRELEEQWVRNQRNQES